MMILKDNQTRLIEASIDALWLKKQVISNNIANIDTPNFKASQVRFETVLERSAANPNRNVETLQVQIQQDRSTSINPNGNNVNLETEQLALWETYAHYSFLVQNMSKRISNLRYVINNTK